LVFWINTKFSGHCPCLDYSVSSHITLSTTKGNLIVPSLVFHASGGRCSLWATVWCHY
jgi:hypothetical protein